MQEKLAFCFFVFSTFYFFKTIKRRHIDSFVLSVVGSVKIRSTPWFDQCSKKWNLQNDPPKCCVNSFFFFSYTSWFQTTRSIQIWCYVKLKKIIIILTRHWFCKIACLLVSNEILYLFIFPSWNQWLNTILKKEKIGCTGLHSNSWSDEGKTLEFDNMILL